MLSNHAGHPEGDSGPAPEKSTHQREIHMRRTESIADTNPPKQIPPIRIKTVLAIIAVSGIYFAQVYCLVGAGAVSVVLLLLAIQRYTV